MENGHNHFEGRKLQEIVTNNHNLMTLKKTNRYVHLERSFFFRKVVRNIVANVFWTKSWTSA